VEELAFAGDLFEEVEWVEHTMWLFFLFLEQASRRRYFKVSAVLCYKDWDTDHGESYRTNKSND
jgi:hypothetical protein